MLVIKEEIKKVIKDNLPELVGEALKETLSLYQETISLQKELIKAYEREITELKKKRFWVF